MVICCLSQPWPGFAPRAIEMQFIVKTALRYSVSVLPCSLANFHIAETFVFLSVSLEMNNGPYWTKAQPTITQGRQIACANGINVVSDSFVMRTCKLCLSKLQDCLLSKPQYSVSIQNHRPWYFVHFFNIRNKIVAVKSLGWFETVFWYKANAFQLGKPLFRSCKIIYSTTGFYLHGSRR
jgi:hypothetical protein